MLQLGKISSVWIRAFGVLLSYPIGSCHKKLIGDYSPLHTDTLLLQVFFFLSLLISKRSVTENLPGSLDSTLLSQARMVFENCT
jgi:hypothetical protein